MEGEMVFWILGFIVVVSSLLIVASKLLYFKSNYRTLTESLFNNLIRNVSLSQHCIEVLTYFKKSFYIEIAYQTDYSLKIYKDKYLAHIDKNQLMLFFEKPDIYTSSPKYIFAFLTTENKKLIFTLNEPFQLIITENVIEFISPSKELFLNESFFNVMTLFLDKFLNISYSIDRSIDDLLISNQRNDPFVRANIVNYKKYSSLNVVAINKQLQHLRRVKEIYQEILVKLKRQFQKHDLDFCLDYMIDNEVYYLSYSLYESILSRMFRQEKMAEIHNFFTQLNVENMIEQYINFACNNKKSINLSLFSNIAKSLDTDFSRKNIELLASCFGELKITESVDWLIAVLDFKDSTFIQKLLDVLVAINDINSVPKMKLAVEQYINANYSTYDRVIVQKFQYAIKKIQSQILPEKIGGLSLDKDEATGLLSLHSENEKAGSLSLLDD